MQACNISQHTKDKWKSLAVQSQHTGEVQTSEFRMALSLLQCKNGTNTKLSGRSW